VGFQSRSAFVSAVGRRGGELTAPDAISADRSTPAGSAVAPCVTAASPVTDAVSVSPMSRSLALKVPGTWNSWPVRVPPSPNGAGE